jgi:hypothetical protein
MRKYVTNGYIEVAETQESKKWHNPSTHDDETRQVTAWIFTPFMCPSDAELPRTMDQAEWDMAFNQVGKKLPPIKATSRSEFPEIVKNCEEQIGKAYKERYEPTANPDMAALANLGFK